MSNKNTQENKDKKSYIVIYALLAFLSLYLISTIRERVTTEEIKYNEFITMVENKEVESVTLSSNEIIIIPKEKNEETKKTLFTGNVDDPN